MSRLTLPVFLLSALSMVAFIEAEPADGDVRGCSGSRKSQDGTFTVLEAFGKIWPADGFCRAHSPLTSSASSYHYTVSLNNVQARGTPNNGHPGVMFNVVDNNNYDVIFFRIHLAQSCYQTGYMQNGQFHWIESLSCPAGPPQGLTWFTVRVDVTDGLVNVYLDGRHVVAYGGHYPGKASVGALVANGYDNIIHFKEESLSELDGCPQIEPPPGCTVQTVPPPKCSTSTTTGKGIVAFNFLNGHGGPCAVEPSREVPCCCNPMGGTGVGGGHYIPCHDHYPYCANYPLDTYDVCI